MNQSARILVVDDDDVIIRIITNILTRNGYETDSCHSGEETIVKVKLAEYDLVLLDVQMGKGLDGYQTCQKLQKINPDLPIILVTANQDDESVNNGFESGSSDYIKKPVSKLELLARVNKTISLKRAEKSNLQLIDDLSKDLRTAANIQVSMLPKWIFLDNEMMFSSHYAPSESVGGDLFDRIKISDTQYVVYIGDISGHGVQAALLMTAVKAIIKIMVESDADNLDLPRLVTKLNDKLCSELFINNNYMTLLIGIIDLEKESFHYLNAGHPPVIELDTISGETRIIDATGSMPVGWMPKLVYKMEDTDTIQLTEHNIILLFTDGIYECVNPQDEQFGLNGLIDILTNRIPVDSCVSLPFKVKHYLAENNYEVSGDDFTLFAFQKQRMYFNTSPIPDTNGAQAVHFIIMLRAALREVGKTAQQCEKLILNWTDNPKLAAKVELIIDEFLNNIIKYGYNFQEDSVIVVEFIMHSHKLVIKFWDRGINWQPPEQKYSVDKPYSFDNDMHSESGKGVNIIMSMSNSLHRDRYDVLNETVVEINLD
jgi:serine phosphatase RsbU (regulator of sigma subunit)/anti-sigma regulatory factor (Ser/Thr protein kinase)